MNSVSLQPGLCRAVHPVYGYGDAGRRMRMPQAARPCPHGFKYHGFLLCAETGIPCQGLRMWGYHAGFPGQAVQGLYIHQKALFLSGAVPMLLKKSAAIQHLYSGYRNPGGFLSFRRLDRPTIVFALMCGIFFPACSISAVMIMTISTAFLFRSFSMLILTR